VNLGSDDDKRGSKRSRTDHGAPNSWWCADLVDVVRAYLVDVLPLQSGLWQRLTSLMFSLVNSLSGSKT